VLLAGAAGYAKYRYDLYEDHRVELNLRASIAESANKLASITREAELVRAEISRTQDSKERRELQAKWELQTRQITQLQKDSISTTKQLETHKDDQGSQDPLLKDAYAQIDNLQAQLIGLRAQGKCVQGYVWREASDATTCVSRQQFTPKSHSTTARSGAPSRRWCVRPGHLHARVRLARCLSGRSCVRRTRSEKSGSRRQSPGPESTCPDLVKNDLLRDDAMTLPLCFELMPFGTKTDTNGLSPRSRLLGNVPLKVDHALIGYGGLSAYDRHRD
jgi:hypothetical protein